ncbi:hypothetical protein [Halomonas sp. KO116]|uniref:hypothetical protein n=1 Tax=Halomonas sp. KO116 TaxID=1504981 RepID=UPI0004E2AD90|nr:hypothetical protein [Halomonas sp. KO116]AJY53189.1 hypothetical protein KO116_P200082 [Halomonas sp. KO116]
MMNPSEVIEVPAQLWEPLTEINSCSIAAMTKEKIVPVKAKHYQGRFYTAFGTAYGPFGARFACYISAYELTPAERYQGETYETYYDEEAIASGARSRGDHLGLVVKVQGKKWVCSKAVRLEKGLPSSIPVSLTEAKKWLEESYGRYVIDYPIKQGHWAAYEGNPVRCYHQNGSEVHDMLYRDEAGGVLSMRLCKSLALDTQATLVGNELPVNVVVSNHNQLGMLF